MAPVSPEVTNIIRAKQNRYCRAVDGKIWEPLFDTVALPDATFLYTHADGRVVTAALEGQDTSFEYDFKSRAAFVAFFKAAFEPLQTIHTIDGGDFEQVSDTEVKAVFIIMYFAGPQDPKAAIGHGCGGGHYHTTYKKVGDDWFLSDLKFVALYHRL
ncbi:hypothetical protein SLS62_005551 [Diatrype stigma]|uniref:SnoaL-like domain-containing protein n=1 Tax=Diatrype stigma TaxID=117547 RepID=A0AAN9UR71_9PEZI